MVSVAGVDGFRGGWVVVVWDQTNGTYSLHAVADFAAVLSVTAGCASVAIDMPIGFLDAAKPGGRDCETAARKFVGGKKASSVFSSPVREALAAPSYPKALATNQASSPAGIGISKQCFMLFPKMRDIDRRITPALQDRIKEIHPEVSFAALARKFDRAASPLSPKDGQPGRTEREQLLRQVGFATLPELLEKGTLVGAQADDVLDACVAAWSAGRLAAGQGRSLPADPPKDGRGLEMAIWY